ncbi:MAG: YfhO family protein [Anaerolineales bacterium]|nr:YfhO family protein [Anaerolineales bacterium]
MKLRRDWSILALTALGPLLLFGPMLLLGKVLYWGTPMLQFVPWHEYALDVVRQGHIPFWNPLSGFGAPLLANYQSALLYPPNILLAIVGPAYGHGLLVALHLVFAGIGMVLLCRRLGMAPRGQLVAGIAFSLSGYLVARAWFISINHAAAWLPWIIFAADRLAAGSSARPPARRWSDVLGLGALFALQWLAGHAQTSWYTLVFTAAWVVWRSVQQDGWRRLLSSGFDLFLSGSIAFVLSAIQLVPTLEYLLQSQRAAGLDPEFALTYSFWPWRLVGLIAPDLFGNPASGTYWGYGNYWEDAIYIGIFPLLMAIGSLTGLFRKRNQERDLTIFLASALAVAFIFSLGKNTFVFRFLYEFIPTFNLFQAPARWNLLSVFCLALLAGIGVGDWVTPEGRGLYWARLGTAGAGIVGAASYVGARLLGDVQATFVPAFARAGLLFFIAGLLTLFLNKRDHWRVIFSLAAFVLLDLATAGYGLNPAGDPEVFQGQSQLSQMIDRPGRVYMPVELEEQIKFEQTHRFDTFNPGVDWRMVRDVGLPNTTMLDGIYSANNFDPFTPDRYARWLEWVESLDSNQKERVLRWSGVRWHAVGDESEILGVAYRELAPGARVWMVPEAFPAGSGEEVLRKLAARSADVMEFIYIETVSDPLPGGGRGEAEIIPQPNPNRIRISASSDGGSWLFLSDTWYPGWEVLVDGELTELYRANYLFMAVWVPEGEHAVDFVYRPTGVVPAAAISGIGWLAVILLWGRARRS